LTMTGTTREVIAGRLNVGCVTVLIAM
jgi:hypothetical protein